ncbi:unnamed protein product [Musa acuminata subsp. malaccensis]|uniref:glutamate formimidoyltransferase n=1 Tax=Musa acuminata subsp. malaccensis TaxID=214687 RepID=A0A804JJM1_MUSAM|nr:PREDICTED: uncharacterized protein LOC103988739 [Musa acuminata subsp. malaccensis]CAG1847248.1 unnamed protein product [Musa acuminata subsp. malaccensis]
MFKSMLACCKLYISESRNPTSLALIEQAAKAYPEAVVINKFKDEIYNRVGYTLVSPLTMDSLSDVTPLSNAVFEMVKAAFESIDLETHSGTHPRLGVVDHICFHPMAKASLDQAAGIAKSVAADISHKLQVPTYLYGAANEGGRTLDSIRRELGYFKPNSDGNQWTGGLRAEISGLKPDAGPLQSSLAKGVVVIGATRWVDNYNVPVWSTNIEAVRKIARKVSERGGGLESVQAMGLAHGAYCTEVACNLLNPSITGADQVQHQVQKLASEEGFKVGEGYFTDFSQEKIIEMYFESISCDST